MSIRVVVIDDSVVIRRLVVQALETDPDIEVVATGANGKLGIARVEQHQPDAITMDIEMPEMNGVDAVRELRKKGSRTPIIMFSTLTERGATATLDALTAGASDYVTKPSNVGSLHESLKVVADQLIPKIKALVPQSHHPHEPWWRHETPWFTSCAGATGASNRSRELPPILGDHSHRRTLSPYPGCGCGVLHRWPRSAIYHDQITEPATASANDHHPTHAACVHAAACRTTRSPHPEHGQ